jgi:ribonuclease R
MEITPQGEVVDFDFVDCVINSKKAMTYEDVNLILEQGEVPEDYEEFVDNLLLMDKLATKLEKRKVRRGYVNLGNHEVNIEMSEDGKPVKFSEKKTGKAEKLIENFMLLAGECAASYLVLPTPYRVHERPDEERVEEAFDMLEKSGIRVKSTHDICNGHVIQKLLDQIKEEDDRNIAASIILRSMKRARYSVENFGHFGLCLHGYDQFTSPIRRGPDLVTHRNIKMQRDNTFNVSIVDAYHEEIDKFCQHATMKERNADQAERDADQFEMNRYMSEHIGEKFMARVVYINSRGIYIKTHDGIDGKLLIEDIDGDDFFYDPRTNSFNGKKTKIRIKLGSELCLVAVDTKKEYRTVNFGLETEDLLVLKKK